MGGYLSYEEIILQSSSAVDTTSYSKVYNGNLRSVTITTGGVGWTMATTATTGVSSSGAFQLSAEKTGAIFLRVAPPGAGGATYYPFTAGHTSSGGSPATYSTGPFSGWLFPLVNDRLVVQSSSGSDVTAGYAHTFKIIVEGSKLS